MAAATLTLSTARDGQIQYQLNYDDVTGAVSSVTVVNNSEISVVVTVTVGKRSFSQTFAPGTTSFNLAGKNVSIDHGPFGNCTIETRELA